MQLVEADIGIRRASVFFDWMGTNSRDKTSPSVSELMRRYHLSRLKIVGIIACGLRSCRERLGIDVCLN